ncbi:MAG: S-adenosylmethionine:tRNA ribosyltransferase-isomerase [Chitinophagaceae bacterium]|nr:S-adenosylmethionine:tRNA ribosyltransferase-isomerase [Chitinophagaceae bacterium]
MTDPGTISIQDYFYSLPEERIAKYPLAERDASKLLIYKEGEIREDVYKNISYHIPTNSLLIFNNTKVVAARLLFQKPTGGVIEIFCLEPHEQYPDITTAMLQTCLPAGREEKVLWKCLVGGASKWKAGQVLEKKISRADPEIILKARTIEKRNDCFIIELSWEPEFLSFAEILQQAGAIPLPPYIKRSVEELDTERYQTVYAHIDGSVAAPTAGLHFTNDILEKLKEKKIQTDFVTLHVGAGTFKPVKSETMQDHEMHAEFIDVSATTIKNILDNLDNPIIAVGTTSLRTMESLYWLGRKPELRSGIMNGTGVPFSDLRVSQWEAYALMKEKVTAKFALKALLEWMDKNKLERLVTKTQILIAPGYTFKIVKGLITNFHQPQSTLLLLVAALIGSDWRNVYDYALQNDFRFLSYGDGSLLWLPSTSSGRD